MFSDRLYNALLLVGILLGIAAPCGDVHAKALSLGIKIQQEFYKPLVPVTTNFRTCFKTDAKGIPVLAPCTTTSEPQRVPATEPSPRPKVATPASGKRSP